MKDRDNIDKQWRICEQDIARVSNEITNLNIKLKQIHSKYKDEENSYEEPKNINSLVSIFCYKFDF